MQQIFVQAQLNVVSRKKVVYESIDIRALRSNIYDERVSFYW